MAIYLGFSIEGEQQISRKLQKLKSTDLRIPFNRIGKLLVRFYGGEVFDTEGAVIGAKWKDGPYYNKLVRSGTMKKSFEYRSTKKQLEIKNETPYFKYHQSNAIRRNKLPRRKMLHLDEPRRQLVVKEIHEHYVDQLRK